MLKKPLYDRIFDPASDIDDAIDDYLESLDAFANHPFILRRAKLRVADAFLYCQGLPSKPSAHQIAVAQAAYVPRGSLSKWKCSKAKRGRIYERDGYRCVRCGSSDDLTLDHIESRSRGGSNADDNLQTLCRSCNSHKGARVLS